MAPQSIVSLSVFIGKIQDRDVLFSTNDLGSTLKLSPSLKKLNKGFQMYTF